jgi:ABC-2 type transport system ATP-binding protein
MDTVTTAGSRRDGSDVADSSLETPAIAVHHLVKTYGAIRAVDDLSFTVRRGEVFAILGPNGSGKTTTLEMIEGYRNPDSGGMTVLGLNPDKYARELRSRWGVMLQQDGLHPGLTVRETLHLYAGFFADPIAVPSMLETVGLTAAADTRCRRLSGGQKRRLAMAVALIGRPELVFLDEPTTGMDPQARLTTWEIIRGLKATGVTVVLTTHLMDEAERLADRIAILNHGRLVALDTPAELTRRGKSGTMRLVADPHLNLSALQRLRSARETEPGVYLLESDDPAALAADVTSWLRDQGVTLRELRIGHATLEEAYLSLTDEGKEM